MNLACPRTNTFLSHLLGWLLVGTAALSFAQEQEAPGQGQAVQVADELPETALMRFGDYVKSGERGAARNGIYRIVYSPDGKLVATRHQSMVVRVFDLSSQKMLCEIDGHQEKVQTVHFSPDSQWLVTAAGANEQVKIWDVKTGKLESSIEADGYAAYFSKGGNRIHLLTLDHRETYSWPGTQLLAKSKWKSGSENWVGMSTDGRHVLLSRKIRNLEQTLLMDLDSRSKVVLNGPMMKPRAHAFSDDRNWLAMSFERDPSVYLWDLRDPVARRLKLEVHDSAIQSLAFSPDSRFLLSTSWDDTSILWDVLSGDPVVRKAAHTENVNACAVSPIGFQFATGASGYTDCSMLIWDFQAAMEPKINPANLTLQDIWLRLGAANFNESNKAVRRIVLGPDQWLRPLSEMIAKQVGTETMGAIDELIADLDAPDFKTREKATLQLIKIRVQADSQIRTVLESASSPEVRARLRRVLNQKLVRPPRDIVKERRWMRLIFALEQIDSDESRKLLKRIADGHENIDLSRSARASFERCLRE